MDPIYGKSVKNNSLNPAAQDEFNSLIVLPAGGHLQRASQSGRLFMVANQAAVATTAGLATTWTGLGVANPTGSGYNLIFHEFAWGLSVVGADDGVVGLMTTTNSGFAATITPRNMFRGHTNAAVAYADDGATIATPVLDRICGAIGIGATNLVNGTGPFITDLKGGLILQPGYGVCTYTTTATTACLLFSFIWEEVPI